MIVGGVTQDGRRGVRVIAVDDHLHRRRAAATAASREPSGMTSTARASPRSIRRSQLRGARRPSPRGRSSRVDERRDTSARLSGVRSRSCTASARAGCRSSARSRTETGRTPARRAESASVRRSRGDLPQLLRRDRERLPHDAARRCDRRRRGTRPRATARPARPSRRRCPPPRSRAHERRRGRRPASAGPRAPPCRRGSSSRRPAVLSSSAHRRDGLRRGPRGSAGRRNAASARRSVPKRRELARRE